MQLDHQVANKHACCSFACLKTHENKGTHSVAIVINKSCYRVHLYEFEGELNLFSPNKSWN